MQIHITPPFEIVQAVGAIIIAFSYISLSSLVKEPERKKLSAIILGGAGAAYLSSGFGGWEFAFCTLMTFIAYKGLKHYYLIGIGWLLHTSWDIAHHLYANPIVVMAPSSSLGCAICDPIMAIWFFMGAPDVFKRFRKNQPQKELSGPVY